MKRKYKALPYCTKHKLHHGQKYPSCPIEIKTVPTGNFHMIQQRKFARLPRGAVRKTLAEVLSPFKKKQIEQKKQEHFKLKAL